MQCVLTLEHTSSVLPLPHRHMCRLAVLCTFCAAAHAVRCAACCAPPSTTVLPSQCRQLTVRVVDAHQVGDQPVVIRRHPA